MWKWKPFIFLDLIFYCNINYIYIFPQPRIRTFKDCFNIFWSCLLVLKLSLQRSILCFKYVKILIMLSFYSILDYHYAHICLLHGKLNVSRNNICLVFLNTIYYLNCPQQQIPWPINFMYWLFIAFRWKINGLTI